MLLIRKGKGEGKGKAKEKGKGKGAWWLLERVVRECPAWLELLMYPL